MEDFTRKALLVLLCVFASACSSVFKKTNTPEIKTSKSDLFNDLHKQQRILNKDKKVIVSNGKTENSEEDDEYLEEETPSNDRSEKDISSASNTLNSRFNADLHHPHEIPLIENPYVKKWISYYTGKGRKRFLDGIKRGQKYIPEMKKILRAHGVPEELVYAAFVESHFKANAYSHAAAVGMWQFIRGTAKVYGLKINNHVDERRQLQMSTAAAAKYMKGLYNVFGSWYLALASYNWGEARVKRTIMKNYTRDFWELVRKGAMPKETQNHIPKIMAAILIAENPEKFGFGEEFKEIENYARNLPKHKIVKVPSRVSLKSIARNSGIPLRKLKQLNPAIRGSITPPSRKVFPITLPEEQAENLQARVTKLKRVSSRSLASYGGSSGYRSKYKVRRGDSLYKIARRFKVRVSELKRVNKLSKSRIYVGKTLKIPGRIQHARSSSGSSTYKVKSGDSLSRIAKRFGVSQKSIKRTNGLKSNRIYVGKNLKIPGTSVRLSQSQRSSKRSGSNHKKIKIRNGDTLSKISRKYNIKINALKRHNGIRNSKLVVGQVLRIPM